MKIKKYKERNFKCANCDHVQGIKTNREGECLDYCKECSWKPSFGKDKAYPMFGAKAYRRFVFHSNNLKGE